MAMDECKRRDETLRALQREIDEEDFPPSSRYRSWVRGDRILAPDGDTASHPTARCRFFDRHGFAFLPGFAAAANVQAMKQAMADLVNSEWHPSTRPTEVFRTDQKQIEAQGRSDYFLDSAAKCHFFGEKDAIDERGELKEEYREHKMAALNKAGHGLHRAPGPFRAYATSPPVARLLRELGWRSPVVPQSMYIFKQARIGGEVTSHQDSTFLFTTPRQTCVGLWLALDEATVRNGCVWVRPGSHREGVRRQFARNAAHFGESLAYDGGDGDRAQSQMVFRPLADDKDSNITWEGALPKDSLPAPECTGLYEAGFIPVPCRAGDLLVFVGELDHLSLPNFTNAPRHTFQLHCVEGEEAGVTWSKENWLQYPAEEPFMKL